MSLAELVARRRGEEHTSLAGFAELALGAKDEITPGTVTWGGSPFSWMIHNGPVTKNKIGRTVIRLWLESKRIPYEEGPGGTFGHHLSIDGTRVAIHFATQGKEGELRFSALREADMGIDAMYLLGIEPFRARLWVIYPEDTVGLPAFSGDVEGLHSLGFDPDDVPAWLEAREVRL